MDLVVFGFWLFDVIMRCFLWDEGAGSERAELACADTLSGLRKGCMYQEYAVLCLSRKDFDVVDGATPV